MYSYPGLQLGKIELEDWDKLQELAKELGKPYIARESTVVIDLRRKDWLIAICKMYKKGQWEITLDAIRNPFRKIETLREIKQKEWDWAEGKAREILDKLRRKNEVAR